MAVLSALPQLVHHPKGFRSQELRQVVQATLGTEYSPSQLTYDLRKLRGKGLVEKQPKARRFRATPEGLRVAVLLAKLRDQLLSPLIAPLRSKQRPSNHSTHLSQPDCFYQLITRGIFDLCDHLALSAAA